MAAFSGEQREPLCHIYRDILDPGLIEQLGLDRSVFEPAFSRLRDYWVSLLPDHGAEYVMCSALQLREVLETPEDWEEVGKMLADVTFGEFGYGSHQLVGQAVPELIDSGIVTNKEELVQGIRVLVDTVGKDGRWTLNGAHGFAIVANQMREGYISSLAQLAISQPTTG